MQRVTATQLDNMAETITRATGVHVYVYRAYGGSGVHIRHEDTSETDLMGGTYTAREAQRFLAGMIAATRLCPALP